MELMPRITRAQSMDALSSMATLPGYRAVLLAAQTLPKMFPMMMTAAGTIAPARVFVLGAGVAGLQAIATAKRLGAVVCAYDVRPAVKEQVESVGAKFVTLDIQTGDSEDKGGYAKAMDEDFYRTQRELLTDVLREQDVVITTAAVPGKKAPVLITTEMASAMATGFRDCRHRRRARRQLRTDAAGSDLSTRRASRSWAREPSVCPSPRCQPVVRGEYLGIS